MGSTGKSQDDAWHGYARGSKEYTRMLLAMFAAGVATFAQLYSPQGILPSIATALETDPASAALMISSSTLGLAIFAMAWAYIADIWGKSKAMFLAVSIATLLGLIVPWVPSFGLILCLRFLEGSALAGLASVAVAFITEETHPLHAATATGLYVAGTSLGGLLGRIIAGPVAELTGSWQLALTSVSVLGACATLTFITLLPPARRFTPLPAHGALRTTISRVGSHLKDPSMGALYLTGFALMGAFVTVYNYVGFKLEAPPYLFSEIAVSLLFLAYLIGTVSSSLSGRLTEYLGALPLLLLCIAVMIVGIALTMLSPLWLIISGILILTFGFFCGHSIAAGWVGTRATTGKAQATALYNVTYYLGSALIGYLGGLFYNTGGWVPTGGFTIALLLVSGAAGWYLLRSPQR